MNQDLVSTERFVAQLRELKPAVPGGELQLRLAAALREAQVNPMRPALTAKIIHHPFCQWSAAAAALIAALFLSIESTEHRAGPPVTFTSSDPAPAAKPHQVYQLEGGKLVPATGRSFMMPASYRGIQVIDGKAYRKFGRGEESFLELIETAPQAQ